MSEWLVAASLLAPKNQAAQDAAAGLSPCGGQPGPRVQCHLFSGTMGPWSRIGGAGSPSPPAEPTGQDGDGQEPEGLEKSEQGPGGL